MLYTIGYRQVYDEQLANGLLFKYGKAPSAEFAARVQMGLLKSNYKGGCVFTTKEQAFDFIASPDLQRYQDGASAEDYAVYSLDSEIENTEQIADEPFRRLLFNAKVIARIEKPLTGVEFGKAIRSAMELCRSGCSYFDALDWLRASPQNFAQRATWSQYVFLYWVHEYEFIPNREPLTSFLGADVRVRFQGHADIIDVISEPVNAGVYKASIEAIAAEDWYLFTKVK